MFMGDVVFSLMVVLLLCFSVNVSAIDNSPRLGKAVSIPLVKKWDFDIFPNGVGLPKGKGTVKRGKKIYQKFCLSCHGLDGSGGSADELAGAEHGLTDSPPDKTIATYWPYATTLFDFIRRSMPMNSPGVLNNDEVYSVTAYLLFVNDLIDQDKKIDAYSLARIKMPNREGFINIYEKEKTHD